MGFLLALLSFVVAEEVVELEPVQDKYSKHNCASYNTASSPQATCISNPFCIWVVGTSTGCFNDPCLTVVPDEATSDSSCPGANNVFGGGTVQCQLATNGPAYCTSLGTPGNHKYCHYPSLPSYPTMTSCAYDYLKSGNATCDLYFCDEPTGAGGKYCGARSTSRNRGTCSDLVTEAYCKLNPYCYWNSSSSGCIPDACTNYAGSGINCAAYTDQGGQTGTPIVCGSFEIYDGSSSTSGATKTLCVTPNKNAAPNKCYDLAEGGTATANRPSTGTGVCQTYSLPKCAANTECVAQIGTTGPYANYYCGDAIHLSPNSSVLAHIPAFLILLLAVLFAL